MSEIYGNWDRLVTAVLRREEDREAALRSFSDLSSLSLSSLSSSSLGSFRPDQVLSVDTVGNFLKNNTINLFYIFRKKKNSSYSTPSGPVQPLHEAADYFNNFDHQEIISESADPPLNYGPQIIINDGKLSFWLSKSSGKKCYRICARELLITWAGSPVYWGWTSTPESRFSEVAELIKVCWLDIQGKVPSRMLSMRTTYAAYLIFRVTEDSFGLDVVAKASVQFAGVISNNARVISNVNLVKPETYSHYLVKRGRVPQRRTDGWMELQLGKIFNDEGKGDIEMKLSETSILNWKKGLITAVELLGRISHPNVLKLLGYSLEDDQLFLVYEFKQEGSLTKYFHSGSPVIQNLRRLKILIGAARGLAFLHTSQRQGFFQHKKKGEGFYGYFSCSKILLDSDYNPKITGVSVADVGLPTDLKNYFDHFKLLNSRLTGGKETIRDSIWNDELDELIPVKSYLKSDVYGFGVVMTRMVTVVEILEGIARIQNNKDDKEELDLLLERASTSNFMQHNSVLQTGHERQEDSKVEKGASEQNKNRTSTRSKDFSSEAYKIIYVSASRLKHERAGFGGVILNEQRRIINAWAICGEPNSSLEETTLQAIRYAQATAEEKGWKKVQIRYDVEGLMDKIFDEKASEMALSKTAEDIIRMRESFTTCSFVYFSKEWNESCKRFADIAVETKTSQEWSTAFPPWLIEAKQKGS
ncbi:OLC1v1009340C1 [Oldenlandia corymbosa var. corymbosa]|uniref:OLC1v1009340C1 n=1 Tax=Oldenlandia corymbosa var. corymbosa TaxID=529605 RepID=A0AAV1DNX5_OLDCO|nr:OLC1v1009340C1 [Oldenlandia corymbosa var. corymbosa]